MLAALVAVCGLFAGGVSADPPPAPVEVDFAPLPAGQCEFALDYYFSSHGDTFKGGVWMVNGKTIKQIRDCLKSELESDGWAVTAVGDAKMIIRGHKTHLPRRVEFKVDTFEFKPKGNVTPTVRRVKEV